MKTNLRRKNTFWRLTKRIRKELRKEKTFFLFSAKDLDLVNFSKNSKDTYIGPINLRAIFPVKKFIQHPQFLLHNRHLVNTYENRKRNHLSDLMQPT